MRKKQIAIIGLVVFIATGMVTFNSMGSTKEEGLGIGITEEDLGHLCVGAVYSAMSRGSEREELKGSENSGEENLPTVESSGQEVTPPPVETMEVQAEETVPSEQVVDSYDKPLVIIYHTHATESYQPATEGNFHTHAEAGSIREVGDVLAQELRSLGIEVIHDKTMHDSPSYNQSYSRSLETAKALMAKYPTAIFVIDLHRDAASYTGNAAKTVLINGETVAKYSLVVGQGNPNVNALMSYANMVNAKAEELYPGFGGRIIEKAYKFNQYISNYHILLEIGNNENNIKEARLTAKYFAHVMETVIKQLQQ